jgi:uncharacterized membrane protein YsdA (DUF1294 family)
MSNSFSRISENVLFSLLIVAVVGWTGVSVAADQFAPKVSASCEMAHAAAPARAS